MLFLYSNSSIPLDSKKKIIVHFYSFLSGPGPFKGLNSRVTFVASGQGFDYKISFYLEAPESKLFHHIYFKLILILLYHYRPKNNKLEVSEEILSIELIGLV